MGPRENTKSNNCARKAAPLTAPIHGSSTYLYCTGFFKRGRSGHA